MARKLTTILAADVASFSRLVGADEAGTLRALREARAIVDRLIAEHHGRIFSSAGDSVVAEFGSAVEATEAAIAVQDALRNAGAQAQAEASRLRFRIGLNIGDVVVDGDNLMGDGVNVAARIEALAEPGGICLSSSVLEQVRGKVDVRFEPLSRRTLKNIATPVTVFRIAPVGGARPAGVRRYAWVIAGVAAIGLAAGFYWQQQQRARVPAGASSTIAVLPFEAVDDDARVKRLASGLADDIITDLSKFQGLEIVASDSAKASQQKSRDVGAIGKELNVAYLLQGAIQHEAEVYRVTVKLVETASGSDVWAQRWDYSGDPSLDVQTEIAEHVASTIGSAEASASLTGSEIRNAKRRAPASLEAYDLYLLAVDGAGNFTKEGILGGIDAATKAIALDPQLARAYAIRARLHFNTIHYGVEFETAMRAMEADARKAVALDPSDPATRVALAWYFTNRGMNKEAETELRAALLANPSNITVMKFAAAAFAASAHPEEGAALADRVLRLDPLATAGTLNTLKDAYFFARRFADTAALISRVPADARSRGARLLLAMSYAFLGERDMLKQARDELLKAHPNISAELLINQGWKFERKEEQKLFLDGFPAAGLRSCASDSELAKIPKPERLPSCAAF